MIAPSFQKLSHKTFGGLGIAAAQHQRVENETILIDSPKINMLKEPLKPAIGRSDLGGCLSFAGQVAEVHRPGAHHRDDQKAKRLHPALAQKDMRAQCSTETGEGLLDQGALLFGEEESPRRLPFATLCHYCRAVCNRVGIVDAGRPIQRPRHLPSRVVGAIAGDPLNCRDQFVIIDLAIVRTGDGAEIDASTIGLERLDLLGSMGG